MGSWINGESRTKGSSKVYLSAQPKLLKQNVAPRCECRPTKLLSRLLHPQQPMCTFGSNGTQKTPPDERQKERELVSKPKKKDPINRKMLWFPGTLTECNIWRHLSWNSFCIFFSVYLHQLSKQFPRNQAVLIWQNLTCWLPLKGGLPRTFWGEMAINWHIVVRKDQFRKSCIKS